MNLSTAMSISGVKSNPNRLSSTNNVGQLFFLWTRKTISTRQNLAVKSANIVDPFRGISENREKIDSSDVTSDSGIFVSPSLLYVLEDIKINFRKRDCCEFNFCWHAHTNTFVIARMCIY